MLWMLINDTKQAAWQAPQEQLYIDELLRLKYPFQLIHENSLKHITPGDFVWAMHYDDISVAKAFGGTVISQSNGTAVNPYVPQVNSEDERRQMTEIIDICLVFNRRHRIAMQTVYPHNFYIETGFPVTVPAELMGQPKDKKSIIVPGRISPDKQFYLATFLLNPLREQGYSIRFCMPEKGYQQWLMFYHEDHFTRDGFELFICNREQYLIHASHAEFVFSCSLGDVCNSSLAEAMMLGAKAVVPRFGHGLPTYDEYVGYGYTPFSVDEVEDLICYNLPSLPAYDFSDFDVRLSTQHLLEGLERYANRS